MATGLIALLDDIAAIAKMTAASLDDVAAQTAKASAKAAGVVIDDAAVTPRYVVGLTPERELPIIARIALGSLKNKLLFLLPGALVLSYFAPWAITPLLMLGGIYLCYEGAEKLYAAVFPHAAHAHEEAVLGEKSDPVALDRIGWQEIDKKRVAEGMKPMFEAQPDQFSRYPHRQVEHIEIAGALGLGEFDDKKIDVRRITLA